MANDFIITYFCAGYVCVMMSCAFVYRYTLKRTAYGGQSLFWFTASLTCAFIVILAQLGVALCLIRNNLIDITDSDLYWLPITNKHLIVMLVGNLACCSHILYSVFTVLQYEYNITSPMEKRVEIDTTEDKPTFRMFDPDAVGQPLK